MHLYEIDERLERLLDTGDEVVDTATGEIVSLDAIEALEMERADKIEGWGLWLKNRQAELDAVKTEADKLDKRAEALSGQIERSKRRYQEYLAGEKIKTPRLIVSYRKVESVEIDDVDKIPDFLLRVKTTIEPDKTAIKTEIRAGNVVDGAHLATRQSMTIK